MFVISKVNLNKNLKFIDEDRGVVVCTQGLLVSNYTPTNRPLNLCRVNSASMIIIRA